MNYYYCIIDSGSTYTKEQRGRRTKELIPLARE